MLVTDNHPWTQNFRSICKKGWNREVNLSFGVNFRAQSLSVIVDTEIAQHREWRQTGVLKSAGLKLPGLLVTIDKLLNSFVSISSTVTWAAFNHEDQQ